MPSYVIDWTDKYFHQSAFDAPIGYPNKRIVKYFASAKADRIGTVKLYRGVNTYNKNNRGITSWTYDRKVAERYAKEMGDEVIETEFPFTKVLLDTTLLTKAEKQRIGYDYRVDDKEVLILEI